MIGGFLALLSSSLSFVFFFQKEKNVATLLYSLLFIIRVFGVPVLFYTIPIIIANQIAIHIASIILIISSFMLLIPLTASKNGYSELEKFKYLRLTISIIFALISIAVIIGGFVYSFKDNVFSYYDLYPIILTIGVLLSIFSLLVFKNRNIYLGFLLLSFMIAQTITFIGLVVEDPNNFISGIPQTCYLVIIVPLLLMSLMFMPTQLNKNVAIKDVE